MMSTLRFAAGLVLACSAVACASSPGPEPRTAVVSTTSGVAPSSNESAPECKRANDTCFHDYDCCSAECDYDNGFCH